MVGVMPRSLPCCWRRRRRALLRLGGAAFRSRTDELTAVHRHPHRAALPAICHARLVWRIRSCLQDEAVAIRHLDARQAIAVGHEILGHQLIQVQHIGGDGVVFVIRQALRRCIGHGAADVVEHHRCMLPEGADSAPWRVRRQAAAAAHQCRPAVDPLAEIAMAGGAMLDVEFLAFARHAAARRQVAPVGADGDVPAGDLGAGGRAADARYRRR